MSGAPAERCRRARWASTGNPPPLRMLSTWEIKKDLSGSAYAIKVVDLVSVEENS